MLRSFIAGTVIRPVTTTMVTIAVVLFGLVAALRLPVELLPDLAYPTITVETTDQDSAPSEIEELVTRPIEERVGAVPGVVRVESVSREGRSEVTLEFAWGTRIDQAMADVREKLDRVDLPTTASRPLVLRYDPAQEPIMRLALRSTDGRLLTPADLATLREVADRIVKRELEKLPGVAAVELHGGEEDEVLVELDPSRLWALGLTADEVIAALQRDNVNRPGGALTERDNRFLIRTVHEARAPEELGEVIVRSSGGAELRLREIATIRRAPIDREELSLVEGEEAVELAVYREGDGNVVDVARRVKEQISGLPLTTGHEVVALSSQADFVEAAVNEVRDAALVGGGLAVLVLLFFLRDLRSTVVIGVAIPISLLTTFIPLDALDVSLNVMSLGGLALGVGMLVDNSIVVLESVARVREEQERQGHRTSRRKVAVEGTAEVGPSVVASTLTTVAVFFPMSFVEGVAGQLVRDLAYAVSFSIISSMIVSLTLVPVLLGLGEDDEEAATEEMRPPRSLLVAAVVWIVARVAQVIGLLIRGLGLALGLLARPFTVLYDGLEDRYPKVLGLALRHRFAVLVLATFACVLSLRLATGRGQALLPELDQREFLVQVTLPSGASLERTARTIRAMSQAIAEASEVETRFSRVGSVSQAGSATGGTEGTHLGQINVRLSPRVRDTGQAESRLLEKMLAANPESEAVVRLGHPSLLSFAPPIEIQVYSDDPTASIEHAKRLLVDLRQVEGLVDLAPDDLRGRPEVRIDFDRERLGRVGLTVETAAVAVQRAIQGEVATTLFAPDRQLDVRVQLPRADRSSVEDVSRIQISVVEGVPVRLDTVADVEPALGPSEIRRIDGRRGIRIQARTDEVDLSGIAARTRAVLEDHASDDARVEAVIGGQAEEMQGSLGSLVYTIALSLFLVYVVMASSFESLLHPLLIMVTVPLALAGVALGCHWAEIPLSAMVGIGVIVLGGIVVNNAIVLVNAVNDRRGLGMSIGDALLAAGRVRVRPILMTTLTTVLGLLPLAFGLGEGASLRRPLAISIIGGLTFSTLLTLLVIPCAYSLLPGRTREAWRVKAREGD